MEIENRIAMACHFSTEFDTQELGPASGYACPDCNGSLVALGGGSFRCRVGHAWTRDALLAARDDEVENALWVALRSLHEKAKIGTATGRNRRSRPPLSTLYLPGRGSRTRAERARPAPGGQRSRAG